MWKLQKAGFLRILYNIENGGYIMDQEILQHHLMTGVYTYAGNYTAYFKSLPDDIPELCNLICS
jgi:hypothetical protein